MDRSGQAIPAEWARGQLRRIEQRLHRLLETLDRLLDVSRLSSGRVDLEFETVDLAEVVRDVVGSFEAELAVARCEPRVTTPAAVMGWWDRLRLDQICRNLVSNAIRFGAGHPIHVTVEADDTDATLIVRDYGVGIPPHKQTSSSNGSNVVRKTAGVAGLASVSGWCVTCAPLWEAQSV